MQVRGVRVAEVVVPVLAVLLTAAMGCTSPQVTPDGGGASDGGVGRDGGATDAPVAEDAGTDAGVTCVAPETSCGGTCADLQTSVDHCGGCDMPCTAPAGGMASCSGGTCDQACPAGLDLCAGACVDLQTDVDNCGACGYRVVSAGRAGEAALRTCAAGQPSPGWVPITTTAGPTMFPELTGVTEGHLIHIDRNSTRLYDFDSDTWGASLGAPPFVFPTIDTSATRCGGQGISGISLPERSEYFVWFTTGAYRFVDDASPHWQPVSSVGLPTAVRDWNTVAYDGTSVYVLFGADGCVNDGRAAPYSAYANALAYDLPGDAWRAFPSVSWCGAYLPVTMPFAYANGLLAGLGGIAANTNVCGEPRLLLADPSSTTWAPGPDSAAGGSLNQSTFISAGNTIFATTGSTTGWLMDPRGVSAAVAPPPGPAGARTAAFAMFTGRAVFYWGGYQSAAVAGGAIGVVGTTPAPSMLWHVLPTAGQPTAQYMQAVSRAGFSGQSLWTGHEAVIAGGGGTRARFQPPVGCVCPALPGWTYAPACAAVTGTIPTTCAPL